MARGKSLLLGLLIGSTIGAVTTLLTTPSSGKEMRAQLKHQTEKWKDMAESLLEDSLRLKEQIAETSKESIVAIQQYIKDMTNSVQDWQVAVEPHQENIQEYLAQIESSLKELEEKVKLQQK